MQKSATPDPRFKALKQHKKNWNLAMKEVIKRMIAFKRALNGTGDDRFALPASKLQDPIPQELLSFLSGLSSNYEAVASEALKITNEQNEFARAHAEGQKEMPKAASLQVDASNKLTRVWSYLKSPFLSDENKKIRIGLLSSLAGLEKQLEKFEGYILSSGDKSIIKALEVLMKIDSEFSYINQTFESVFLLDQQEKNTTAPPGNIKPDVGSITKAEGMIADIINMVNIPGIESSKAIKAFDKIVLDFKHEKDTDKKIKLADMVISAYQAMLGDANKLTGKKAISFAQLFEFTKQEKISSELNAVASNFISRWLKKKKHNISPFDRTSGNRLNIQIESEDARVLINQLMDTLESELDPAEVGPALNTLLDHLLKIKIKMEPFRTLVRGKALEKAFDPNMLMKMISDNPDVKQVNRLERKYDSFVDRKILDRVL